MVRLSDIIRRGSSSGTERKEKKEEERKREGIRFREMTSLSFEEIDPPATRPRADERQAVEALCEEVCQFVRESISRRWEKGERLAVESGMRLVHQTLELPQSIEILYNWAIKPRDSYEFPVYHVAHVFVFSLKMGRGLKYGGQQLGELGLAALLHDIGYGRIPPEIRQACRGLTPEELREIHAHPVYGYEILLSSLGEESQPLAEVVRQTHERENGQGYPRGLKGKEIHDHAKIIGISDVFEALTHARPHRKRLLPYEAVKEILGSQRSLFPSHILKVLIQEMSVFPIYSYVRLNSGAIGRVIATEGSQPLRPTVEILYDSEGNRIEGGKIIRLVETSLLHITGLVGEKEIAEE